MRKVFAALVNFISKSIAFVLVMLFVVTALLSLLLFNVERQLLHPGLYKRALAEQNVYERFPELVSEELVRVGTYNPCAERPDDPRCVGEGPPDASGSGGENGPPPFAQFLSQEEWAAILALLFQPEWLQAQTESAIDQLFNSLDSESAPPVIAISTKELRERFSSEAGVEAVSRLIRAAPPCSSEQLAGMVFSGLNANLSALMTCSPPDEMLLMIKPAIQAQLIRVAANIPDQAVLGGGAAAESAPTGPGGPSGPDTRLVLRVVRQVMLLSPLLPLAVLLLIAVFGARSLKDLLHWWGVPLLIAGLIGVGIAAMIVPLADWVMLTFAMARLRETIATDSVIAVGLGVGQTIERTLAVWIGGEAAVAGLLGVVMTMASS